MTMAVTGNAPQTGTPNSITPTSVSAAKRTIAPWAKLNTWDALKMSTKPSATSEYITPVSRPETATSARNIGNSIMSRKGATKKSQRNCITRHPRWETPR